MSPKLVSKAFYTPTHITLSSPLTAAELFYYELDWKVIIPDSMFDSQFTATWTIDIIALTIHQTRTGSLLGHIYIRLSKTGLAKH